MFISLGDPALLEQKTGSLLRYIVFLLSLFNRPAFTHRAYKFPEAKSFNIELSNERFAVKGLSLLFSFSSALKGFAWPVLNPPYSFLQRQ